MSKELTVGELRKALSAVPDNIPVRLASDTGVDQGEGMIIVEEARRINYNIPGSNPTITVDYFEIYANDVEEGNEDE